MKPDRNQISLLERVPPLCYWEHNPDPKRTFQTQGTLYCGRCGHFAGFTGGFSWRLTEAEAEAESREVWCAIIGDGRGNCYRCGAVMRGKGAVNMGFGERT